MTFDNIRDIDRLDDTDLRTSLQTARWNKELPAIKDEYGNVIVGHRRLKIAAEEGIEPVIKIVTFGDGPEADAERTRLAVVSNTGAEPLSKEDRKKLVVRLYDGGRGLTMEAIGKIVAVSAMTISRDLADILTDVKMSKPDRGTDTIGRKKSPGRPKGPPKEKKAKAKRTGPKPERQKYTSQQEQLAATLVMDKGYTRAQAATEAGVSEKVVQFAVREEEGRRKALAEPDIDRATLSMTAQQKLDAACRQYQRKLDLQFETRVGEEIKKRVDGMILPHWKKQIADAKKLYESRRALMSKDLFNTIRRALHPDSRNAISDKKLGEAFDAFMGLEKYLLNEKDSPTKFEYPGGGGIPSDLAEWDRMKAKTQAGRSKRPGVNAVRPR